MKDTVLPTSQKITQKTTGFNRHLFSGSLKLSLQLRYRSSCIVFPKVFPNGARSEDPLVVEWKRESLLA